VGEERLADGLSALMSVLIIAATDHCSLQTMPPPPPPPKHPPPNAPKHHRHRQRRRAEHDLRLPRQLDCRSRADGPLWTARAPSDPDGLDPSQLQGAGAPQHPSGGAQQRGGGEGGGAARDGREGKRWVRLLAGCGGWEIYEEGFNIAAAAAC